MTRAGASKPRSVPDRAEAYPISRWYVIPLTRRIAAWLKPTRVRPNHVTLLGLLLGLSAAGLLFANPAAGPFAAALILAAWFMDRTDGLLARNQRTTSPFGAWLDANVDELHDVAWHLAAAHAAASRTASQLPWFLLVGFLAGKYLFMTGLMQQQALTAPRSQPANSPTGLPGWFRAAYHLPGNADVRIHLLVAALASGLMSAELAFVAAYYNFRWIARFGLNSRRMEGCR